MSTRKTHPIVFNLQTLLQSDNDVDPKLLGAHLCKKVEAVLNTLSTVPTLRGVALEALSSAFVYLSRSRAHEEVPPDSALRSLVFSTCEVLSRLLVHSPAGWSHTLFQWGVVNLARLSALYGVGTMPKEGVVSFMMSQSSVPYLVKFVEEGVRYMHFKEEDSIVGHFISISQKEKSNLGWLMAHIISENSAIFSDKPLMSGCVLSPPLSPHVTSSLSSCLDLLTRTHPLVAREAVLGMVNCVLSDGTEKNVIAYLQIILDLLQSNSVLELVVKDILKLVTADKILSLVYAEFERSVGERDKEEGEATDDEDAMECESEGVSLSLSTSLSSLLLRLSGEDAVMAIDLLLDCCKFYTHSSERMESEEEEEEDGEINSLNLARGQLLEGSKQLLNVVLTICHKAVNSLLFSSEVESTANSAFSPVQYVVSIQSGLMKWVEQLIDSPNSSCLRELVDTVGMCTMKTTAAVVLNRLLFTCPHDKHLKLICSLFERFRLRHPGITHSLVSHGVATLLREGGDGKRWCINFHSLVSQDIAYFQPSLVSLFNLLLKLLPSLSPVATIHILSILEGVSNVFASECRLSECTTATQTILDHFHLTLHRLSAAIMKNGRVWELEQVLAKCRSVLSQLSHRNQLVNIFACSNIFEGITNETCISEIFATQSGTHQTADSLLSSNRQLRPILHGSLLNTRQAQHGDGLYSLSMNRQQDNEKTDLADVTAVHCSDHLIWLISDINETSTNQIAVSLMDAVAPNSVVPLKSWPEMDLKNHPRHTLEFHLSIKRKMNEHPILWKILLLTANDRQGFLKCGSLVYSLLFVLNLNWRKNRSNSSTSHPHDLTASISLMQALGKADWLGKPLCYVGELFEYLTCEEVAYLFDICNTYIKDNYQTILEGQSPKVPLSESSWRVLKAILRKNIKNFGNIYFRFVSSEKHKVAS